MKLKIYGCRGSIPLSHSVDKRFGGNTSCIKLSCKDYSIALDAGSGLANLGLDIIAAGEKSHGPQDILLSHLHMDHIIGLSVFAPGLDEKRGIRVFTVSRDDRCLSSQVLGAFKPPYWPLALEEAVYGEFVPIHEDISFKAGPLTITPFAANHPDKTISFHITNGVKSLVYLLDSEMSTMDASDYEKLVNHCEGADMVVFDSAFSLEDYPNFTGWGHSTVADGVKLRRDSGCKHMLFAHFAQNYSDEEILSWKRHFDGDYYTFAADEMEIAL